MSDTSAQAEAARRAKEAAEEAARRASEAAAALQRAAAAKLGIGGKR